MKTQENERVIGEPEIPEIPEKYALLVKEYGNHNGVMYARLAKGYEVDGEPCFDVRDQAELEEKLGRIERSGEEVYTERELRMEFVCKIGALLKDTEGRSSMLIAITLYQMANRLEIDLSGEFPSIARLVD